MVMFGCHFLASRLILAYLALTPRKIESRSKLAAIVWEESEEDRARRNLRQALHSLRTELGGIWDGIEADRSSVWFHSGSIVSDHDRLLEDLRSGVVPDIAVNTGRLAEQLLAGFAGSG